jgi:excisionase family DNA binding protein
MADTYTVKQVARILGFSTNSIYSFLKAKRIKGVRVGKGRFRIPQAEIDRLLLTSSKPPAKSSTLSTEQAYPVQQPAKSILISPVIKLSNRSEMPGLLDWATGIAALMTSISWPLFSTYDLGVAAVAVSSYLPLLTDLTLVVGGIGLILTDIAGKKTVRLNNFFRLSLTFPFAVMTYLYYVAGLPEASILYIIIALVNVMSVFVLSLRAYGILVVAFVNLFLLTLFIQTPAGVIGKLMITTGVPPLVLSLAISVGLVGLLTLSIAGIRKNRFWWWLAASAIAGIIFVLSLVYARALVWPVALLYMAISVSSLFLPVWDVFQFRYPGERRTVYFAFGLTFFTFFLYIIGMRSLTGTMFEYARQESGRKTAFIAELVETSITGAVAAVTDGAANSTFVTALQDPRRNNAIGALRSLYQTRDIYRRLVLADVGGNVVASYPQEVTDGENISATDVYALALRSNKAVISPTIIKRTGGRMFLPVGKVILDSKGENLGILVAEYDLTAFAVRLAELTDGIDREFIAVVDEKGREILHGDVTSPDHFEVIAKDISRWIFQGTGDKIRLTSSTGVRYASSIQKMEFIPWYVISGTPLSAVLEKTYTPQLGLGAVFLISLVFASFLFLTRRIYDRTEHSP